MLLALAAGCAPRNGPSPSSDPGDPTVFKEKAQPVIQRRCAFLGCHGRPDLPLRLFAVDYARIPTGGPGVALDVRNLSSEELTRNQSALAVRVDGRATNATTLLRKVCATAIGGEAHATGDVIFTSRSDPDYQALCAWAQTAAAARPPLTDPVGGCSDGQ